MPGIGSFDGGDEMVESVKDTDMMQKWIVEMQPTGMEGSVNRLLETAL